MRILTVLACSVWLYAAAPAQAIEPADSVILNALKDYNRFAEQATGLDSSRKSNINRILKLMKLSRSRLAESQNREHASWQETDALYANLQQQLEALLSPATGSSGGTGSASSSATGSGNASAPATSTAAGSAAPSGASSSAAATNSAATGSGDAAPRPLVSGERVRVKKLARDIQGTIESIVTVGPSTFQSNEEIQKRKKRFEQYTDAIGRYPQADDPDVQQARQKYLELRSLLQNEFNRAKEQLAQLGDVQTRLYDLEVLLGQYAPPQPLSVPFDPEAVAPWLQAAGNARSAAEHIAAQVLEIEPIAYLPENIGTPQSGAPYDSKDLQRLGRAAAANFDAVQSNYAHMNERLTSLMADARSQIETRWQDEPDSDKRWIFLKKDQQQQAEALFAHAELLADDWIALEGALQRDVAPGEALKSLAVAARDAFLQKASVALSTSRLPEPASDDPQRIAWAKEILATPKYEFGEHGPIILTTEAIIDRERKESDVDIDDAEITLGGDLKFSGTETTWTYRWKEFKFATPLRNEDGSWNIWWITAKNFSSGGSKTPINRWVSGEANEGNPILEENF